MCYNKWLEIRIIIKCFIHVAREGDMNLFLLIEFVFFMISVLAAVSEHSL